MIVFYLLSIVCYVMGLLLQENLLAILSGACAIVFTILFILKLWKKHMLVNRHNRNINDRNLIRRKRARGLELVIIFLVVCLMFILAMSVNLLLVIFIGTIVLANKITIQNRKIYQTGDILVLFVLTGIMWTFTQNRSLSWLIINVLVCNLSYLGARGLGLRLDKRIMFGVLMGALVVIPSGLLNSYASFNDTFLTDFWKVFYAIKPAVFEEIIFRAFWYLFIVDRFVKMNEKRESKGKKVLNPKVMSLIITGFMFSMLHGFNPVNIMIMMLYSIPLQLLYLEYGFMAAISGHFVVDFIRYLTEFYGV